MAENDNWNSEIRFLINPATANAADEVREAALAAGAFPWDENSKDAAMLLTLNNAVAIPSTSAVQTGAVA